MNMPLESYEIDQIAEKVAIEYRLFAWRPDGHKQRQAIRQAVELGATASQLLFAESEELVSQTQEVQQ